MRHILTALIFTSFSLLLLAQQPRDPSRDLFYAIFDYNFTMAESAIAKGANVNSIYNYERYADECRGWTPAHAAVALGNIKILKLLKENGADFEKTFAGGDECQEAASLLHVAASYGSIDALNYLIEDVKIPVDKIAADGRTPLFDAVINGQLLSSKLLLDKGANPNHVAKICTLKTTNTPIYFAIERQWHQLMDLLFDRGASIDPKGVSKSLLIHAIENENLQASAVLISKGADPSVKDNQSRTAMELAYESGNESLISLLKSGTLSNRDKKILSLLKNDVMKKFKLMNQKAPVIQFSNLNGTPVTSASFKGNLLLVNVWATWCSPCIKEMPGFEKLLKKMRRPDIKLLAVSIDDKTYKVEDFVKKNPYPFIFLLDPNANIRKMFVGTVPATFIINKRGEWVAKVEGSVDWDKKEIRTFLEFIANE